MCDSHFKFCRCICHKSYAECVEGVLPAVMHIALAHSGGAGDGAFRSSDFIKKWKELLGSTAPGWAYRLLRPIVLDVRDE